MKKLDEYTVVVAPEVDYWWAYVPAIPGCHAMGDTPAEARSELEGVFEMFLEEAEEDGRPMPRDVKELVAVAG